jgi:hypothetical protein
MPSKHKDVEAFFERLAVLETKVAALMTWQKVQMAALTAILAAIVGGWVAR